MSIAAALALLQAAAATGATHATPAPAPAPALPPEYGTLAGSWIIDLSVEPGAPYTQPMELTINPDRTVAGEFYGSRIEAGRAGRNQGRVCVSFQTSDGMGPYYHAACVVDGVMVGQSWAEHRQFVLPWSATRKTAATAP
jgi:hypothetical protein